MFYLERTTTNSVVTGNSMSGALPPQSLQQISGREFSRHTFSPLLSQEAWWVAQYLGSILLGIKISVILPHLWDEVPSLKSSIASPSQGWWYPTAPTVLPPGLWEQGWTRWTTHGERLLKCESTHFCAGLSTVSPPTLQDLPVLSQLLSSDCKYHLCLLQKGQRSGMILFQYLSDLPWTELIPDRNVRLKTYSQKSLHAVQQPALEQKDIRNSLEEEEVMLTEEKEKLIMFLHSKEEGPFLTQHWFIPRYCYLMDYLHKQKGKKQRKNKIRAKLQTWRSCITF